MYSVLFLLATISAGPSTTTPAVLSAAVQQWRNEVEFKCTFRLRAGFAHSMEEALEVHIAEGLGSSSGRYEATGVVVKSGEKLRYSIDYGAPLRTGAQQITNVTFDQSSDGRVYVVYNPLKGQIGDTAHVHKQSPTNANTILASRLMVADITPLRPIPFGNADPFLDMPITGVTSVEPNRIEVSASVRRDGGDQHLLLRFWTQPSPPVIESVVYRIGFPDGRQVESRAILSKFQECPGGLVARRLVYARSNSSTPNVAVREWVSDDLGIAPPTAADFIVTIPATTRVHGLRGDFAPGEIRKLNPSGIRLNDVEDPDRLPSIAHAPTNSATSDSAWIRNLFLLGNVAAVLGLAALWIRGRLTSKSL